MASSAAPDRFRVAREPAAVMDDLDRALVARLQRNGRESNRSLAAAMKASEGTISQRLKRLEESGVARVVAIADARALGRREFVIVLVRVIGRSVMQIAGEFSLLPEAIGVTVTTGRFDLVVTLLARDRDHVGRVLAADIGRIEGVDVLRSELALDVLKFESRWAQLAPESDMSLDFEPGEVLDELDVEIVAQLQVDARRSNRKIARALSVAEGTVRARLKRLHDVGAIRIQALCDVAAFGVGAHAYVGIEVEPGSVDVVRDMLTPLKQVAVLFRSLGEFDLIAVVHAVDRRELVGVVLDVVAAAPGVRHTETMESFQTIKHVAEWGRILV